MLKYLRCDAVDEFVMLTEQLIKISDGDNVDKAKTELDRAIQFIREEKRSEAARHAVKSYQILYFIPQ